MGQRNQKGNKKLPQNTNGNKTHQILYDETKTVIAINKYINKGDCK